MQQPITRRDVYEPGMSAVIGGRALEASSVSMERMLPDPVAGDSLTAAAGSIVAVEGDDVEEITATPWDPGTQWPPVPEASASVSMDTGSGPVDLLTGGRVVSASGGTGEREVSINVADRYQSLDQSISWDAVAATMPSLEWDWDSMRYVGMNGISIVDMILRHCGWYATPPRIGFSTLSIPGNGTMWPETGVCVQARQRSDNDGYPVWRNAPWGVGVDDFTGEYTLAGNFSVALRGRVEFSAMTTAPSDYSRIEVLSEAGLGIYRMQWTATLAHLQMRDGAGVFNTLVTVPRSDGFLYATIEQVLGNRVRGTIRSGGAVGVSGDVVMSSTAVNGIARTARIVSTGTSGGFQVAFPSNAGLLSSWTPNAVLYPRSTRRNHLDVRESVAGVNCADFLKRLAEAECATYWIDETGVLRWWDLARLEGTTVAATLTSDDDITDSGFTWSHSLSSVRSRVSVKWEKPLRAWSAAMSTDLWQGNGGTLQPGEVREDWINVPNDEIWIMTDTNISRAPGTNFNYGWGSWYGGRGDRGDGVDTWAQSMPGSGSLLMTIERVNDRAFKTWIQWTGTTQIAQRAVGAENRGSTWSVRYDMDLPIIRGKAKFTLTDQLTYSTQSGSASSPEMVVDVGWLIQDEAQAQYTADYYGARVTVPQPVLSSIGLIPVPGLQIGDMVEVRDEAVTRLTVRGLVVEDIRSINSDMDMRHSVAVRPLYITRNGVTWEEWATAARPKTHAEWATGQGGTWATWGANPLLKEDVI